MQSKSNLKDTGDLKTDTFLKKSDCFDPLHDYLYILWIWESKNRFINGNNLPLQNQKITLLTFENDDFVIETSFLMIKLILLKVEFCRSFAKAILNSKLIEGSF